MIRPVVNTSVTKYGFWHRMIEFDLDEEWVAQQMGAG